MPMSRSSPADGSLVRENVSSTMNAPRITLIGGPTAIIEITGFRFLTDPTFDEPGEYKLPNVTLTKTSGPALSLKQVGAVDAVLLSHDQHSDTLDNSGRAFLKQASRDVDDPASALVVYDAQMANIEDPDLSNLADASGLLGLDSGWPVTRRRRGDLDRRARLAECD